MDQIRHFQELGFYEAHQSMAKKKKLEKQQRQQAAQNSVLQESQQNSQIQYQNSKTQEMEDIINMDLLLSQTQNEQKSFTQKDLTDLNIQNSFGIQNNNNLLAESHKSTQRSGGNFNNFINNNSGIFNNTFNQNSPSPDLHLSKLKNNSEFNESFNNTDKQQVLSMMNEQNPFNQTSNIKEEENEHEEEDENNIKNTFQNNNYQQLQLQQQHSFRENIVFENQINNNQEDLNIILVLELPNGQNHEVSYKLHDDVEEVALNIATRFNIKKQGCDHIMKLLKETQQQFIDERNAKLQQEEISHNFSHDISSTSKTNLKQTKNGFANYVENQRQQMKGMNTGIKLYEKGMKDKNKQKERLEKMKSEQENILKQELTFQPIINKNSKEIVKQKETELKRDTLDTKKYDRNRHINMKVEMIKQQKQFDEMQECTFKPKINDISSKIIEQKSSKQQLNKGDKFIELYNDARLNQLKKDELAYAVQQEKLREQQEQKMYLNQINKQHQKYQSFNHNSLLNNELSFLERMQIDIKNKREKMKTESDFYENFTEDGQQLFKPQIGRPPKIERNKENMPVYEYLYSQRSKSSLNLRPNSSVNSKDQQNKSYINSQQSQFQNSTTQQFQQKMQQQNSQEQFKPDQMDYLNKYVDSFDLEGTNKTNNRESPQSQDLGNSINNNTFQNIQNGRKRTVSAIDDKSKNSSQVNSSGQQRDVSPCFQANQRSQQLFNLNREKKLRQIFEVMDSDNDGLISAEKIELRPLSTQILEAFSPMLLQMEQLCIQLNMEQFLQASQKVIDNLSVDQKNNLFYNFKHKWEKKKLQFNDCSFKPQINQKSLLIAQKQSQSQMGMYEQQVLREQQKEQRIRFEQQKLLQKELEECSFQPHLYKSHLIGKKLNSQQH